MVWIFTSGLKPKTGHTLEAGFAKMMMAQKQVYAGVNILSEMAFLTAWWRLLTSSFW